MSQPTFKSMRRDGSIKRGEAVAVRLEDIHIEPGHNERDHDDAFWQSVKELRDFLEAGGTVPPLEVRPRPAGGVWIVDGERRSWAYKAGEVLATQLVEAKAQGKKRVTASVTKLTFDQWFEGWYAKGGCGAAQKEGYRDMFQVVWVAARAGK